MKKIFLMLVLPFALNAQTPVTTLTRSLDSLTSFSYDNWKMSSDLRTAKFTSDPAQPGFDDHEWETLRINQSVYPDSCWLRKEITLPDSMLGKPVRGVLRFLVTVDDYGVLYVNGEKKGLFLWDGTFELTRNAKPGQKFVLAIRAINTGGPLRLLRAGIETDEITAVRQSIRDFALSLQIGQRLLSFDTYQENAYSGTTFDPGIDKSAISKKDRTSLNALLQNLARQVNADALARGSVAQFLASMEKVRSQLRPIDEFAKRFTLVFTSNAHIDAAWLWREKETIIVAKNTFNSVLDMMDAGPDFTYSQSAAQYYEWMEVMYPSTFKRIQKRIQDGRWEVVGGLWIEPDCNMPSGESWVRQLLYAQRYFKSRLGITAGIGWNPDSFGYNWNMPQFMRNAGIDAFVTQKISWNESNVFPYRVFWWESPDGSRVLTYFPFSYVNNVAEPYGLVDWLRQFEANTGFRKMMVLFGVGDHGGGPTDDMLERVDHMKTLDIAPTITYETATKYIAYLKQQDPATIPVWKDELYLEYHQGTFTTQAKTKEGNRKSEILLTDAEKLASFATLYGEKYPDLHDAWKNVLFNQFHDILPGSGIREVYVDAAERYATTAAEAKISQAKSIRAIERQVNTTAAKHGTPLIVFNSLSWKRTGTASYDLPDGEDAAYAVFDLNGKEVLSQTIMVDKLHRRIIFSVADVPAMGYTTCELRKKSPALKSKALTASTTGIENEFFKITLDPDSGWVKSIVDKRNGKELLAGNGNRLQALEDKPAQWDAWNVGWGNKQYPTTLRSIDVGEQGPLAVSVKITRDMLGPSFKRDFPAEGFPSSFFTQEITLYSGVGQVFFKTSADWWEEKTILKVAFPFSIEDTVATYEIPYGSITRSTQSRDSWEKAKREVGAERWVDVSRDGYGISLLNNSKYGFDFKGNVLRMSMLRSSKWPDPTADRGKHVIEYALYPHTGSWKDANTVRHGYEFNYPFIVAAGTVHGGALPATYSFVGVEPKNCILNSIKKSEDGNDWILQFYESGGQAAAAVVTLPRPIRRAVRTNFLEEVVTIKVSF
ncbi:MAG: glycosyl hydrolase-related protein [Ignavibacteriales bacterium]|nr:glycosyl hydrolase-related protein [Ignavibacteriales bacterium]